MILENSDKYSVTCSCRRLLVFVLAAALVFGALCVGGVSGADVWDGSYDIGWYSSSQTTFTITTAEQLAGLAKIVNGEIDGVSDDFYSDTIKLGNHLILNDDNAFDSVWNANPGTTSGIPSGIFLKKWSPIGNDDNPFRGTFDGGGYTIDNLYSQINSNDQVGLFGYVKDGTINDVHLMKVLFLPTKSGNQKSSVGALVGVLQAKAVVKDCHVVLTSRYGVEDNSGGDGIGGLIGKIVNEKDRVINGNELGNYLQGEYSVAVLDVGASKAGLIVGRPNIDANNGNNENYYFYSYTVYLYKMGIDGDYPNDENAEITYHVSQKGSSVDVHYMIPYGFVLDEEKTGNQHTGTLTNEDQVFRIYCEISPSYMITIPTNLFINTDTKTGTLDITATELWMTNKGRVEVSVSSKYDFHLSYEGKQEGPFVKYELRLGNSIINENSVAATFRDGSSKPGPHETPCIVSLTAELTGHPPYVGSYNDILTFTAEYKESAPART